MLKMHQSYCTIKLLMVTFQQTYMIIQAYNNKLQLIAPEINLQNRLTKKKRKIKYLTFTTYENISKQIKNLNQARFYFLVILLYNLSTN